MPIKRKAMAGGLAVSTMKELTVPAGPWSYRAFQMEDSAIEFRRRLPPDHPQPFQLAEDYGAPDGRWLAAGSWVVLYRVFE